MNYSKSSEDSTEFKITQISYKYKKNIDLINAPTMYIKNTILDHSNNVMNIDTGTITSGLNIQNSSTTVYII